MDSKIKVLHIMSSFGGGISSFIRNKVKSVDSSKIVFDIATFNDYPDEFQEEITSTGGNVYSIPNPKREGFGKYKKQYQDIIRNHGPYQMVHCHVGGHRAFFFYLLSKQMGVERFVVHAHSSEPYFFDKKPLKKSVEIEIDRALNRLIATQKASCGKYASRFYFGDKLVDEKKIMHIPNSIDVNKYMVNLSERERVIEKKNLGIPTDKWIVGHVGRFDRNKNHIFMIELVKLMKIKNMPFYWIFVGTGVLYEEIKELVKKENLQDYIKVLGRREDVNQLYPLMDVFVLPSYSEGLPTVCVEAQASGAPCVVSDTITKEIDMGLGMVYFASLLRPEDWIHAIQDSIQIIKPSQQRIREKLIEKKFSNEASAKLYEDFILGEKSHYEL